MQEGLGADIELDHVARESGLSRPHFYKLFRSQTGVTPNLYLNTLLMERAIDTLVTHREAGGRHRLRSRLFLAERLHPVFRRQCRHGADGLSTRRAGALAHACGSKSILSDQEPMPTSRARSRRREPAWRATLTAIAEIRRSSAANALRSFGGGSATGRVRQRQAPGSSRLTPTSLRRAIAHEPFRRTPSALVAAHPRRRSSRRSG